MEKQYNEERLMRRLMKEAGVEEPSANFKNNIMEAIEGKHALSRVYQPLISPTGWMVTGVCVVISVGLLIWFSGLHIDLSADLGFTKNLKFPSIHLPELQLSRTMQYAIAFIALFFLQIPFLKNLITKED